MLEGTETSPGDRGERCRRDEESLTSHGLGILQVAVLDQRAFNKGTRRVRRANLPTNVTACVDLVTAVLRRHRPCKSAGIRTIASSCDAEQQHSRSSMCAQRT